MKDLVAVIKTRGRSGQMSTVQLRLITKVDTSG